MITLDHILCRCSRSLVSEARLASCTFLSVLFRLKYFFDPPARLASCRWAYSGQAAAPAYQAYSSMLDALLFISKNYAKFCGTLASAAVAHL
jgi:hypothetical protein